MVESFLALWAAGGERAEDFDHPRQDKALCELIGVVPARNETLGKKDANLLSL